MNRISEKEAALIAEAERVRLNLGVSILKIVRYEDIEGRKPAFYNVNMDGCWVAYLETAVLTLCASTIIAIDQSTGEVLGSGISGGG